MKKVFYLFLIIISYINAQEFEINSNCKPEIFLTVENVPVNILPVTYTFLQLGEIRYCHGNDDNCNTWFNCISCDANPAAIVRVNSQLYGINHCSHDPLNNCDTDNYGYTLYKVTLDCTDKYFYLNLYDCAYWHSSPCSGYGADINIHFDYSNGGNFQWKIANTNNWISINEKEVLKVWDIFDQIQNTYCFPDYWKYCLTAVTSLQDHSYIIWGSNPDISNPTKYKIYRAKGDPALQQLTYTWVGETPADSFSFNDNAIITDYGNAISYYVTAVNSNGESSPTNYVQVIGRENWSTGLSMTTQGSNPRLVWVPYDSFTPAGYKIYRSINTSGGGPGTFGLVATTTGQGTVWVDQDLAVGSPWKVYYKVKAYKSNPSQESDFTNVVETGGSAWMKQNLQKEVFSYTLSQNYPNPFNPMTNLTYSVAEAGLTQIKVYDLLGREISALVNEYRERGTYSVNFNAGNLPSGVYIYTIRVNDFQQSKKMTLLK